MSPNLPSPPESVSPEVLKTSSAKSALSCSGSLHPPCESAQPRSCVSSQPRVRRLRLQCHSLSLFVCAADCLCPCLCCFRSRGQLAARRSSISGERLETKLVARTLERDFAARCADTNVARTRQRYASGLERSVVVLFLLVIDRHLSLHRCPCGYLYLSHLHALLHIHLGNCMCRYLSRVLSMYLSLPRHVYLNLDVSGSVSVYVCLPFSAFCYLHFPLLSRYLGIYLYAHNLVLLSVVILA